MLSLLLAIYWSSGSQHRNLLRPEVSCIPTALAAYERGQGLPTLPDALVLDLQTQGRTAPWSAPAFAAARGWAWADTALAPEGCDPCLAILWLQERAPQRHAVLLRVEGTSWEVLDPWGTPGWGPGDLRYLDREGGRWHELPESDRWRLEHALLLRRP